MLQINTIIYLTIAVVIAGICYFAYDRVYDKGYQAAVVKCDERFAEFQKRVDLKLQEITEGMTTVGKNLNSNNDKLSKDIAKIRQNMKQIPAITIVGNKCVPTPEYISSVNQIIDRVNQDRKKKK